MGKGTALGIEVTVDPIWGPVAGCVVVACLVFLVTAALYWAPKYDSLPPEAAPTNPLALLVFWLADRLADVRALWEGHCWACGKSFASGYDLALHRELSPSCAHS